MCRFVAYKGLPLVLDDLLFQPDHSLVKQSYDAREIAEPLNGDGFGVGWYAPRLSAEPAVFASITPAWSNRNLRYMAPKIASPVVLAHVRAASHGMVAEPNCHPFHYGQLLMMHNGTAQGFDRFRRPLLDRLSQERFDWIQGNTDSQHAFALFLDHYLAGSARGAEAMAAALRMMLRDMNALRRAAGVTAESRFNLVVTDGAAMVACRYVDTPGGRTNSLHYAEGRRYVCNASGCHMQAADHDDRSVIIASEPLTTEAEHWHEVPPGSFVLVDHEGQVTVRAMDA